MPSFDSNDIANRIRSQTSQYLAESLAKKVKEAQDELANLRLVMGQEQTNLQDEVRTLLDYILLSQADRPLPEHIAEIVGRHEERRIEEAMARGVDPMAPINDLDISGTKTLRVKLIGNGDTISFFDSASRDSVFKL